MHKIVSFISFLVAGAFVWAYYRNWILPPIWYVIFTFLIMLVNIFIKSKYDVERNANYLTYLTVSALLSTAIASFINQKWEWDAFLSSEVTSKIFLTMILIVAIYFVVVLLRVQYSYKEKRKNQRIKNNPSKSEWQKRKEQKEKLQSTKEVFLVLGEVADNEVDD